MTRARALEFLRFCAVGAGSALTGMTLLALLTDVAGIHYMVSYVLSFLAVNALAYLSARRFAFGRSALSLRAGLLRYYGVTAFSLVANAALLYALVSILGWWYLGSALLLAVVNAPVNYWLHRRLSFGLCGAVA